MTAMLRGFTVGITADRRWDEQAALFERRGASVMHGPSIRTLPLGSDDRLRAATEAVVATPPDALIANTGLGIRSWFSAAETWGLGEALTRALVGTRIYARGPKASGAIHSAGLEIASRAPSERLREAVDLALADLRPGETIALQCDGSGRSPELERMTAAGARVVEVPVYEWQLPLDTQPAARLADAIVQGRVHALTFTAAAALRNFFVIARDNALEDELLDTLNAGSVVVGCVGPVCAEVAVDAGIDPVTLAVPDTWRIGPLVRAVTQRLAERVIRLTLDGASVVIAGTAGAIDDEAFTLTDTEARLLADLAAQPNVVRAKSDLLTSVWGSEARDPHLVEVTIARLRRRLGRHGSAIASVHRRGYVLRTRAELG
jgi:uroporphyrinogen-III synthase